MFSPPDSGPETTAAGADVAVEVGDILQMVGDLKIEKKFPIDEILKIINQLLQSNGHVRLKFRRHTKHAQYTGEYVVGFTEIPHVGEVVDNVIVGPMNADSNAYHEGVCLGDMILSINGEDTFHALGTKAFHQICKAALIRDGKLSIHLEHSEHRAEVHHDLVHPTVHQGFQYLFGGGCFRSGNGDGGAVVKYQDDEGGLANNV